VKIVKRDVLVSTALEELFTEAAFLSAYEHENMVAFHGVHRAGGQVMLVEELGGVSLEDALTQMDQPLDRDLSLGIMHDIVKALAYLHQRGVVLKDLRPQNILLCSTTTITGAAVVAKLSSFGQAQRERSGGGFYATNKRFPQYCAPEVLVETRDSHASFASDCFSIGVIAWQLLSGVAPWAGKTDEEVIDLVLGGERLDCSVFHSDIIGSDVATLFDDAANRPDMKWSSSGRTRWRVRRHRLPLHLLHCPPRMNLCSTIAPSSASSSCAASLRLIQTRTIPFCPLAVRHACGNASIGVNGTVRCSWICPRRIFTISSLRYPIPTGSGTDWKPFEILPPRQQRRCCGASPSEPGLAFRGTGSGCE
jgi:serine/threonine protein kinase